MKKYIATTIAALLALSSCDKTFLDKTAYDAIPAAEVLTSQKGMEMLLNGAYDDVQSQYYYGALLYLYEAAKGPDFFVRNVSGGFSFYTENRYAESSNLNGNAKSLWLRIYNVIRNTTILIENIDSVVGDVSTLRRIKGEAYALRGLAYFDLSRLFAYPPKYSCTWGSSYNVQFKWGVPIIDTADMGYNVLDYEIKRATADDTWAYITEQYDKAFKLLEGVRASDGHVGPEAVLALRLRAALYMEDFAKVVELGNEWLEKYESSYSMLSYESYPTQYYKPFNSESIWEIKYSEADNLSGNSLNYWVRHPTYDIPGSEVDGEVSQNVGYAKLGLTFGGSITGLESMQSYAADVRRCLICKLGIVGKDYNTIRKYVGDPYHFLHNIPVVRLPEIYLSLAEAYFMTGDTPAAVEMLSKITTVRRNATASVSSINNIINERRREFILEGQTYWDFFRTGRTYSRPIIESISSNASISFGSPSGISYRVVYPIPLAEMNANPAIREQQNPGYAAWEFGVEDEN